MIDTSPAIQQSSTLRSNTARSSAAQSKARTIYVRRSGNLGLIISDGRNAAGKWHIIDICFGNTGEAIQDLKAQGYIVKEF